MKIRSKLLLAFGIVAVFASAIAIFAVFIHFSIGHDIRQISHSSVDEANAAEGMADSLHDLEIAFHRPADGRRDDWTTLHIKDEQTALSDFASYLVLARKAAEVTMEMSRTENSPMELAEAPADVDRVNKISEAFDRLRKLLSPAPPGPSGGEAVEIYNRIHELVDSYRLASMENLQQEIHAVEAAMSRANAILLFSSLAILFIGLGLGAWIAHSITRPLTLLTAGAEQIARGRLDTRIDFRSRDEIGLLATTFDQMAADLQSTTVSKDFLDSIFSSMVNALIVIGSDRTVITANVAASRILGYQPEELPGIPMERILSTPSVLDEAIRIGRLNEVETTYRTRTGDLISVSLSAAALHDPDGRANGLVCVAQDISARRKAESDLEKIAKRLLETSRQAGMAEVAASILHNVGNVLNSVNVSCGLLGEKLSASKTANLAKVAQLLQSHADNLPHFLMEDPKGRLLPTYLADLADHLEAENKDLSAEVESLTENILHIKEIVGMQQNYARVSGMPEECNPAELMEIAVRINAGGLERHRVTIVRDYAETPPFFVEKHKVLQILVNLLSNAKYACTAAETSDKRVTLHIASSDGRIRISVEDNGVGIPPENLSLIFTHGFTTKREGHGFGLHNSALAATEMSGTLIVHSEGLGTGATFTLELPIAITQV